MSFLGDLAREIGSGILSAAVSSIDLDNGEERGDDGYDSSESAFGLSLIELQDIATSIRSGSSVSICNSKRIVFYCPSKSGKSTHKYEIAEEYGELGWSGPVFENEYFPPPEEFINEVKSRQ